MAIARAITDELPEESIVYVADGAYFPYGEKTDSVIAKRVTAITRQLVTANVKLIVLACNSITTTVIDSLRDRFPDTPFVGVVPSLKPAVGETGSGVIAVFGTQATLRGDYYRQLKSAFARGVRVLDYPCPEWVRMIEAGERIPSAVLEVPVRDALRQEADTFVLGCTHFSFIRQDLAKLTLRRVTILESSQATARQVRRVLAQRSLLSDKGTSGSVRYQTTGRIRAISSAASIALGASITFTALKKARVPETGERLEYT